MPILIKEVQPLGEVTQFGALSAVRAVRTRTTAKPVAVPARERKTAPPAPIVPLPEEAGGFWKFRAQTAKAEAAAAAVSTSGHTPQTAYDAAKATVEAAKNAAAVAEDAKKAAQDLFAKAGGHARQAQKALEPVSLPAEGGSAPPPSEVVKAAQKDAGENAVASIVEVRKAGEATNQSIRADIVARNLKEAALARREAYEAKVTACQAAAQGDLQKAAEYETRTGMAADKADGLEAKAHEIAVKTVQIQVPAELSDQALINAAAKFGVRTGVALPVTPKAGGEQPGCQSCKQVQGLASWGQGGWSAGADGRGLGSFGDPSGHFAEALAAYGGGPVGAVFASLEIGHAPSLQHALAEVRGLSGLRDSLLDFAQDQGWVDPDTAKTIKKGAAIVEEFLSDKKPPPPPPPPSDKKPPPSLRPPPEEQRYPRDQPFFQPPQHKASTFPWGWVLGGAAVVLTGGAALLFWPRR